MSEPLDWIERALLYGITRAQAQGDSDLAMEYARDLK